MYLIRCRKTVGSLLTAVLLMLVLGSPARAGNEIDVYGGIESFTWREFDASGQLLKEAGPRFALGVTNAHEFPNHLTLRPRAEIFGGSVDYRGQACDIYGSCLPDDSTTDYFGVKLEMDAGFRVRTGALVIEPFGGLGLRFWSRSIADSVLIDGSYAAGYTENWSTFYGRLGIRAEHFLAGTNRVFLELGAKLPASSTNYIDDRNVSYDAVTLHPGNKPSLFAEAGFKTGKFRISAYYDTMRFNQSEVEYQYDPRRGLLLGYQQPRSESDMIGIRIGVAFY